ncbi:hypothetical protein LPB85_15170 [Chryseobacterium sp. LC2016-27]|uniref:hypothetical protein n=1 Tax=Chryseobacterium sp. LC2016-27 TaxID=2897326 RepID=UPI001E359234|nr:hypothetical protein [Chryseobacterium sp. LC2016-27]MCD0456788.1 hypothetical protein [Chryseobacterium sp. LC2016-27]
MKEFYHVSQCDLSNVNQFNLQFFKGRFTNEEHISYLKKNHPNGISQHGGIYLFANISIEHPNDLAIETVFELVRQLKFSNRKSRFEVSFGCKTLQDAIKINSQTFNGKGEIYKVSCERYTLADMNLLSIVGTVIDFQLLAEMYWTEQESANPFWEVLMENPVNILEKVNVKNGKP